MRPQNNAGWKGPVEVILVRPICSQSSANFQVRSGSVIQGTLEDWRCLNSFWC